MTRKCYRFVTNDLKSQNGNIQWKIGEWVKYDGELKLCNGGLHACFNPTDSLDNIYGSRWFLAETRGIILEDENKFCATEMRLVKEIPLKVIQLFAVDCAEHVLPIYEKIYPNDDNVSLCIKMTRAFIENPTEENHRKMDAAAWAARAARDAVRINWTIEQKWQNNHLKILIREALKNE